MTTVFTTLRENIQRLDIDKIFYQIISDKDVQHEIEKMNRLRLSHQGIDIDGEKLKTYNSIAPNVYSSLTIGIKKDKGQRTDIVTLKDEGNFHQSIKAQIIGRSISVIGDFQKEEGNISDNLDTAKVLGVTDINIHNLIIEFIIPMFTEILITRMLRNIK